MRINIFPSPSALALAAAAVLAVAVAVAPAFPADRLDGPFPAQVTKVRDGDTLEVTVATWLDQSVHVAVRIDGIDTPEKTGKCPEERALAEQASEVMRTLVADPAVTLSDVRHDKYAGRALARVVTRDGTDVGREMVRQGLARPYHGEKKLSWCEVAAARSAAKGKP